MGCPNQVQLEGSLPFSVTIHDPETAALVTPDAAPSYRVYEDLAVPAILSGTMSLQDSRTGFYAATIACTTANGFEDGKYYTIEIEAVVGGITAGTSYEFYCGKFPVKVMSGDDEDETNIKLITDKLGSMIQVKVG
jgi:hypothetical protein